MPPNKANPGGGQSREMARAWLDSAMPAVRHRGHSSSAESQFFLPSFWQPWELGTVNGFLVAQGEKLRPKGICPTLGPKHRAPQPQRRTSSRSSTDARRICLHLCTSALWNCFCRARISAHSVAVCGNLLHGVQGLSAAALPNLPNFPTPSGRPLTPWPGPDCARPRRCGLPSPKTRGGKRGGH